MMESGILEQLTEEAARDGIAKLIVGAVIEQGGAVLLLKRPADDFMGGIWELPSGNVDAGETLDAALRREVTEETGLEIASIDDYLGSFDYLSGSGKPSRQFTFAVRMSAHAPVRLREHDDSQWVSLDDELPVTDAVKVAIARFRQQRQR